MKKNTNDLVILDYCTGTVHFYQYDATLEMTEEYISNLGYDLDNIYYMCGNNLAFHKHRDILEKHEGNQSEC